MLFVNVIHLCDVGLQVVDMVQMVMEAVAAGARVAVHMAMDMALVSVCIFNMMYYERSVCQLG